MILIGAFIAVVWGQVCQNVLVDDFRPRNSSLFRTQPPEFGCEQFNGQDFNGCNKTLNFLGGDYGDAGATQVLTPGQLAITARNVSAQINNLESESHPNTAVSFNYWFVKFDWENDFDLTPYDGFKMDVIAPPGSDFNITLTQWLPASNSRGIDSQYRVLSSYITPNGALQTVSWRWSDFGTNLNGVPFDLKHLKDLTLVNFEPVGTTFIFRNLELIPAGCFNSSSSSPTGSNSSISTVTGGTGASAVASISSTKASGATVVKAIGALFVVAVLLN